MALTAMQVLAGELYWRNSYFRHVAPYLALVQVKSAIYV